ncbi:hypothetical protein AT5A_09230 [Agrobacterium tumefaciens 5A]|nr:hypothetical protein AT5A_09230 [Agrobacterium tumefaciens 5A]
MPRPLYAKAGWPRRTRRSSSEKTRLETSVMAR